jgi:uncharacterized NAD-dependent epimerase/dehydratase family protein
MDSRYRLDFNRADNCVKKVGAVIVFSPHVDAERVRRWIAKLQAEGHVESADVQEFNAAHGEPVFYIP